MKKNQMKHSLQMKLLKQIKIKFKMIKFRLNLDKNIDKIQIFKGSLVIFFFFILLLLLNG